MNWLLFPGAHPMAALPRCRCRKSFHCAQTGTCNIRVTDHSPKNVYLLAIKLMIKTFKLMTHSVTGPAILVGVGGPLLAARLHVAVTIFALLVVTVSVCLCWAPEIREFPAPNIEFGAGVKDLVAVLEGKLASLVPSWMSLKYKQLPLISLWTINEEWI